MNDFLTLIAATSRELLPLRHSSNDHGSQDFNTHRIFQGSISGIELCSISTGIGRSCVRRTLEEVFERIPIHRALLIGICGGVLPGFKTGQSLLPARIQDVRGEFALKVPLSDWPVLQTIAGEVPEVHAGGVLVTTDRVQSRENKERLLQFCPEVQAVDMEALEFGRICHENDCSWAVLKTIADPSDFEIPQEGKKSELLERLIDRAIQINTRLVESVIQKLGS